MERVTNLMPYEIDSLKWVAENFDVEEETLQGFASSLSALAWLYLQTLKDAKEFREGRVVILGLLNQAHHWLTGGLSRATVSCGRHVYADLSKCSAPQCSSERTRGRS
jgi:hypothetical protein